MDKAEQYEHFARECMGIARGTDDLQLKDTMLHMARVWARLAEEHRKHDKT